MTDSEKKFDPSKHMSKIGNADYLPVAARMAWFRSEHPDGTIESELHKLDEAPGRNGGSPRAIFRATVTIPSGGRATAWGSETLSDFGDYIEKASTKSVGRALAAMGYGTLESGDEYNDETPNRPVDAPQRNQRPPERRNDPPRRQEPPHQETMPTPPQDEPRRQHVAPNPNEIIGTDGAQAFIQIMEGMGFNPHVAAVAYAGKVVDQLTRRQARELADWAGRFPGDYDLMPETLDALEGFANASNRGELGSVVKAAKDAGVRWDAVVAEMDTVAQRRLRVVTP